MFNKQRAREVPKRHWVKKEFRKHTVKKGC
jgi:hypothetical protein